MLRSEFRFSLVSRPGRLLAFLLGEAFLGFLALVAVALTLFPLIFAISPAQEKSLNVVQWVIIGWFAVEYAVALASTPSKAGFLRDPWRWLDLATILIPLASLLPSASHALLSSPVLRLARLVRLVTLGLRVSGLTTRRRSRGPATEAAAGKGMVTLVADAPTFAPRPTSWEALIAWVRKPGPEWFHVSNPDAPQLAQITRALDLPAGFLESQLQETAYPHLASIRGILVVFIWMPELSPAGRVARRGLLFLLRGSSLLSFTRSEEHSMEKIAGPAPEAEDEAEKPPFAARMLALVLRQALQRNERLIGGCESRLHGLEDLPIRESSPAFFEEAFRLKRELSTAQADLWRLKGILADLAAGRRLPEVTEKIAERFTQLATEAEYLHETVVNLRDEVLSVIDLHLNIVSFDMNRVMRVLAVVSVLGLIPAVIGGLFGMNLIDNPWPFTLPQVAFAVVCGMVFGLYFFFIKGWLR